jgi:glycosyltransferase involved in cell wall biosynthesis
MKPSFFDFLQERLNFFLTDAKKQPHFKKEMFLQGLAHLIEQQITPQKVIMLYLVFLGRYPSSKEIEELCEGDGLEDHETKLENHKTKLESHKSKSFSFEKIYLKFTNLPEFIKLKKANLFFRIKKAEAQTLYVDVSHTLFYPHNSGIQKVVRNASKFFKEEQEEQKPVRFFYGASDLRPLELEEELFPYLENANLVRQIHKKLNIRFLSSRISHLLLCHFLRVFQKLRVLILNKLKWKLMSCDVLERFLLKTMAFIPFSFIKDIFKTGILRQAIYIEHYESQKKSATKGHVSSYDGFKRKESIFNLLYFENSSVLLMELGAEAERIAFYETFQSLSSNKLTVVIHDLIPLFGPEYVNPRMYPVVLTYFAQIFKYAHRISTVSHFTRTCANAFLRGLEKLNKKEPVIETHTLGIETLDFQDALALQEGPKKDREESSYEDIPMIVYVSTIQPRKNQIQFLKACELLFQKGHKFKVVIAGESGWLNDDIFKVFYDLKEKGYEVELKTGLTDEEIQSLYHSCYFSVFCSYYEGFGLPILESFLYGKPVITSHISSMKEIGEEGGALTVNPYLTEDIALAIERLLVDKELYETLTSQIPNNKYLKTWKTYAQELYHYATS